MKLYIDFREDSVNNKRAQKIKELFMDKTNYAKSYTPLKEEDIEIKRLDIGDIVYGNVCIEIKEGEDLINSINDKHIFEQIDNMAANYKHNYLIIIGDKKEIEKYCQPKLIWKGKKPIKTKGNSIKSINGICASFKIRKNIHVENYLTIEDAIESLIPVLFKGNDGKKGEIKAVRNQFNKTNKQINLLISYEGVSEKKARNLLKKFKTIRNVMNADIKDLKKCEGIGTKIASEIVDTNSIIFKDE